MPARAADLQVSPVSLEISAAEQSQAIFLSNNGKTVLRAQVRVQQWTQADDSDQLLPTRDVIASPPIVEIAPGGKQMVRIVRLQPAPAAQERTYRLIIDELPGNESASAPAASGLQFLLRYSVPVFVLPVTLEAPQANVSMSGLSALSASVKPEGQTSVLRVHNSGSRRIKLSQLTLVDGLGQRAALAPGLLGYVLADQRMQWPLTISVQALQTGGTLTAKFNDDPAEQILPLAIDRP